MHSVQPYYQDRVLNYVRYQTCAKMNELACATGQSWTNMAGVHKAHTGLSACSVKTCSGSLVGGKPKISRAGLRKPDHGPILPSSPETTAIVQKAAQSIRYLGLHFLLVYSMIVRYRDQISLAVLTMIEIPPGRNAT
jgi:hypothetical protein